MDSRDEMEKIAIIREELAHFRGEAVSHLKTIQRDLTEIQAEVRSMREKTTDIEMRVSRLEDRLHSSGRWWNQTREWLAYFTALVAVAWNMLRGR